MKIAGAAIVAFLLFLVSAVLVSCSGQSSTAVSKDLAQKLTDSFQFENGKQVAGNEPLEHKADALYPQVTGLDAPGDIKSGDSFELVLHTDFATPADITGAVVAVENKGVYAGDYIDVTAQVTAAGGVKTMTLKGKLGADYGGDSNSYIIKIGMHKADGQVGNYYEWNLQVNGGGSQTTEIKNPTAEQKSNAQNMATDILSFGNTIKTLDSGFDTPLGTLQTLFNSTFNLAESLLSATGTRSIANALTVLADCGSKSGDTITYTCGQGIYTAVGTIVTSGDQLNIDVQLGNNQSASMVQTVAFKGSLTIGSTSLDGTISVTATTTSGGVNSKFSVENTYANITFTAAEQCPMGGGETAQITEMVTGGQSAPLFKFDVTFGPACGDMKMTKTLTAN